MIFADEQREHEAQVLDLLNIQLLAIGLHKAKESEELCRDTRINLEEQLASLIPGPDCGQRTIDCGDGIKVTVKRSLTYKADIDKILAFTQSQNLPAPIKSKTVSEIDPKGYEWYREARPDAYKILSEFVTVKPAKTSVTVQVP